jgi:hypothetical protein
MKCLNKITKITIKSFNVFPIKNIRTHVTNKLEEITVFSQHCGGNSLSIIETGDGENDEDRKKKSDKILLDMVTVTNLPDGNDNIWIMENEFNHNKFDDNVTLDKQKGAFTAAGKKVEKTILYHHNNRLYILLIEMKRTISPRKMKEDVIKKYENSLSTLALFLCTHNIIPTFESAKIFPIAICCYNYYEDTQPNYSNDPITISKQLRETHKNNKSEFLFDVNPIALSRMRVPILLCQNPNQSPVTLAFEIDFQDILKRAMTLP